MFSLDAAALGEESHDYISTIVDEMRTGVGERTTARESEILNVKNSISKINRSNTLKEGKAALVGEIYDVSDGPFRFLDNPTQ